MCPSSDCHSGYYSSLAPRAPCCGPRSCPLATLPSSVSWAGTHHATLQLTALHPPCLPTCFLLVPTPPAPTSSPVLAVTRETTLLSTSPCFLILCYQDVVQGLSMLGQPSASLHPYGGRPPWPDSPGPCASLLSSPFLPSCFRVSHHCRIPSCLEIGSGVPLH